MWLPVLLLAVMASGSPCPESCQCHAPVIECHGHVPSLDELNDLSSDIDEILLREVSESQLRPYVGEARHSRFLRQLSVVHVTNCSKLSNPTFLLWNEWNKFGTILPNIKLLNISHNALWEPDIFGRGNIQNFSLSVLDAGYNKIKSAAFVDARYLSNLTWLSLAGNNLNYIKPHNFRYLELLEFLDLSDNVLRTLEGVFDPLRSLRRLNVAGNKLEHVQANWFQNLNKLVELDISRNKLTFIPADTLQPLASLSVLNLAENPLIERDLSLLFGTGRRLDSVDASRIGLVRVPAALMRSVRALKLVGNQLTSINSGDLDSYPLLRVLDLSSNRLMIIEEDALGRLDNLERLILAGNILPTIPKSLPSGLKIFDLRQNAISKLKANDLQGLYRLKELNLSGNVITTIEGGSFRQLPALETLDISDNPIEQLPSDTLSGPTNLATLRMSGLMSLKTEENQNQDTAFPILTPERLVTLDISRSPALAAQLLADNAALSACKSLEELDLSYTNVSAMRSDVAYVLPRLQKLNLVGNEWNCSSEQFWLGEWIRQHETSVKYSTRCSTPTDFEGKLLQELPALVSSHMTTTPTVQMQTNIVTSKITELEHSTSAQVVTSKPAFNEIKKTESPMKLSNILKSQPNSYSTEVNSLPSTSTHKMLTTTLEPSTEQSPLKMEELQKENTTDNNLPSVDYRTLLQPTTTIINEASVTSRQASIDKITKESKTVEKHEKKDKEDIQKTDTDNPLPITYDSTEEMDRYELDHLKLFKKLHKEGKLPKDIDEEDYFTMNPSDSEKITTNINIISTLSTISIESITDSTSKLSEILSLTKPNQPAIIPVEDNTMNKYKEVDDFATFDDKIADNGVIPDFSRSKVLNEEPHVNDEPSSVAEELQSQATESGARTSESLASGAHPGMLVLLGAAIGAAAALTVVLSRRATVKRKDRRYQRHENIEVHALTPTTELW